MQESSKCMILIRVLELSMSIPAIGIDVVSMMWWSGGKRIRGVCGCVYPFDLLYILPHFFVFVLVLPFYLLLGVFPWLSASLRMFEKIRDTWGLENR